MKNPISRRAVIKGATATATLALGGTAKAQSQTVTLASLVARHKAMHKAMTLEGHEVDALEVQLKEIAPAMPNELTTSIEVLGDRPLSPGGTQGWTLEALDRYIASGTYFKCTRTDLPGGGFTLESVDLPLPPVTLAHMRRVRSARESYDASIEVHFATHAKRQEAWENSLDKVDAALRDIIAFPATSLATLYQKTGYLRTVDAIADGTDIETAQDIADSLIADILSLTATA